MYLVQFFCFMENDIAKKNKPFYTNIWFFTTLFCFITMVLVLLGLWIELQARYPTTSPLNTLSYIVYSKQHLHIPMSKQTIAFLPYWKLSDAKYTRFDLLSDISYFSLTIDEKGNFIQKKENHSEPGWQAWNSQTVKDLIAKTQITGNTFSLTLANQKNKTIETFLQDKTAQQHLINNTLKQITSRHLNGVTLDFEYEGQPDGTYSNAFTQFASNFATTLHKKAPGVRLNLTLLPLSGREKGLFDLPAIVPLFDRFIGMSYDYYALGSDVAGPIAPMNGFKENKFFFDVTTTYEDYMKYIPKEKIVMGIPYYGYDWAVTDGKKIQSATFPQSDPNNYVAAISYAKVKDDTDIKQDQCMWDDYAKEPWCWYTDSHQVDHQVWFENNESIKIKYRFARQSNFAGVAIWTLGYDKNYPDLWNVMKSTLKK